MNTGRSRFRSWSDVTHWMIKNWRVCNGDFVPRSTRWGRKFDLGVDLDVYEQIPSGKWKIVCVNDGNPDIDFETEKAKLCAALDQLFPEKSSFEK